MCIGNCKQLFMWTSFHLKTTWKSTEWMAYLFHSSCEHCSLSNQFDCVSCCACCLFRHLTVKSVFIMWWTDEWDMLVLRAICLMVWRLNVFFLCKRVQLLINMLLNAKFTAKQHSKRILKITQQFYKLWCKQCGTFYLTQCRDNDSGNGGKVW